MTLSAEARAGTDDVVVLLDAAGRPRGTAARADVHTTTTPLHLAFSVHLFRADGRVLLTRRALTKKAWPGVWTNSCCGHPRPEEPMAAAVARRVGEELGVEVADVRPVLADFAYRAVDASGVVEHEVCPVHVARLADDTVADALRPDPGEVAEWAWVAWGELVATAHRMPQVLSPWSVDQLRQLGEVAP